MSVMQPAKLSASKEGQCTDELGMELPNELHDHYTTAFVDTSDKRGVHRCTYHYRVGP
jgi:hypothetical protein